MSWILVEETESVSGDFTGWAGSKDAPRREKSGATIALAVYRCSGCRALSVVRRGDQPFGRCGKCKL